MIVQGVQQMSSIVEAASDIEEELRKQEIGLIVTLITAFIGFVPFAGPAVRAAGLVRLSRVMVYGGELSVVSLNMYSFVSGPDQPANLMFVMFDAVTIFAPNFARAAATAKQLYRNGVLGAFVETGAQTIQQVNRVMAQSYFFPL